MNLGLCASFQVGFTVQLDGPPTRGRWQVAGSSIEQQNNKEKEQGLNEVRDSTA